MIMLFTMAGLSSRFCKVGYTKQKFMLRAGTDSLFSKIVTPYISINTQIDKFVFAIRKSDEWRNWLIYELSMLGISNYVIVELPSETAGQAETAALALKKLKNIQLKPVFIANIDTIIHDIQVSDYSPLLSRYDGIIEVSYLSGTNWSFVEPYSENSTRVVRFLEKQRISNLASTGLYGFASAALFINAFNKVKAQGERYMVNNELYISGVYQHLIEAGCKIHYRVSKSKISLSGTPEQYIELCKTNGWEAETP